MTAPDAATTPLVSTKTARAFVYENGTLWERALFAQLFEGGDREHTIRCLAAHQNQDGGWAHALEHDIRTPVSNAPVAEFALGLLREFDLVDPDLVSATARWCLATLTEEGDFALGDDFHSYPRAPWWQEARRWPPTAIAGRLAALGAAPPALLERTRRWVERGWNAPADAWPLVGLSMEDLNGLDVESWRYRLYHYADYFLNVPDAHLPVAPGQPTPGEWRSAIVAKAVALAEALADAECALGWASTPAMPSGAMPEQLIERRLTTLATGQQADGGWGDAHGLPQWRAVSTIWALKALREHGRL